MRWIGQHIWDLTSRFRNDVYLEDLTEVEQEFTIQVAADGKLTKSTAPSERSRLQVRNDEGSVIPAGAPLYSRGEIGGSSRIKVGICVSSDPAKMPCIGIAQFEMNTSDTKDSFAITQGVYNTNISGFTGLNEGDILYVNGGVAPYLTQTKPTNGDLIQNVGVVLKTNGTICQGLLVSAIGRTNDVPWPLYVDHTTQRVSIGTSSPTVPFHVVGDARIQGNLTVNGTYTQIDTDVNTTEQWLVTNDGTGPAAIINQLGSQDIFDVQDDGTSVFYIEDGGNVGIGTASPTANLEIGSDGAGEKILKIHSDAANSYFQIESLGNIARLKATNNTNLMLRSDGGGGYITKWTNGAERMRIDSSGNVGIGTSSPSSKLHVAGEITTGGNLTINSTYPRIFLTDSNHNDDWSIINNDGKFGIYNDTDTSYALTIDGSNKVGIGTTNPSQKLDVAGSVAADTFVSIQGIDTGNPSAEIDELRVSGYGVLGRRNSGVYLSNEASGPLHFGTGGRHAVSTRMTIDSSGNVGIGTTSPQKLLEVKSSSAYNSTLRLQTSLHNWDIQGGESGYSSTAFAIDYDGTTFFRAIGTTDSRFSSGLSIGSISTAPPTGGLYVSGNVGIGTTSPTNKLDVAGNLSATSIRIGSSASGEGIIRYNAGSGNGVGIVTGSLNSSSIGLFVDHSSNNRNVGIGTATPSEKLEVAGNIKVGDNNEVRFGAASDLRIFHNGALTYLSNQTGDLYIRNQADDKDIIFQADDGSGGNATYLTIDGSSSYTKAHKHILFEDNAKAMFGTGGDMQILHDGSNSYISQNVTGNLYIENNATDSDVVFRSDNGSGGLATYLQLDGSSVRTRAFKDVNFDDNVQATFGASSDLKIYHDGSNSYIKDSGTGNLYTLTNAYRLTNAAGNENMIWAAENSFVKLYYNNSEKLATTSTGVEVTGNIALTGSVQKQISTSTHTINFGAAGSATQNYFLPFVQQAEQAAPNNTHRMVVPYDGIIKKVIVHSKVAFGSSAAVRYHRIDNGNTADFANDGSTDDVTTDVTIDMSTAYTAGVFNFTTGNAFSAGDQIALSLIRGNTALGDVVVTVVYEYELF